MALKKEEIQLTNEQRLRQIAAYSAQASEEGHEKRITTAHHEIVENDRRGLFTDKDVQDAKFARAAMIYLGHGE